MVAPDSTIWGKIASDDEGHEAKLGLAISLENILSTTNVTIDIWFWSEWSVLDKKNTLYFDNESTTPTTSRGNVEIDTKIASGGGWNIQNQVHLGTYNYSYERTSSNVTINCAAKLDTIEAIDKNPLTVTASYTIPSLASAQSVYIGLEDGVVYARAFMESDTIYIDNTGIVYAPAFVIGNAFSISASDITATAFVEGLPS